MKKAKTLDLKHNHDDLKHNHKPPLLATSPLSSFLDNSRLVLSVPMSIRELIGRALPGRRRRVMRPHVSQ